MPGSGTGGRRGDIRGALRDNGRTLRGRIKSNSEPAALLLGNISVMRCERLRKTNERR